MRMCVYCVCILVCKRGYIVLCAGIYWYVRVCMLVCTCVCIGVYACVYTHKCLYEYMLRMREC